MAYAYVREWRKRTKERALEAMGSKCCTCGYNRCAKALDFHHIDPLAKEFTLTHAIKSWSKIVVELRKCVLVCSNCHREIHAGVLSIPNSACCFDEKYAVIYEDRFSPCKVCGKLKKKRRSFCSLECSRKGRQKIDWDKYDLIEMNKTASPEKIGTSLGISGAVVRKRLKRIRCPVAQSAEHCALNAEVAGA